MLVTITGGNIYEDWYAKFNGTEMIFDVEFTETPGRYRLKEDKKFTIYGDHAMIVSTFIAVLEDHVIYKLTDKQKAVKARPTIHVATVELLADLREAIDDFNEKMNGVTIKRINVIPEYKNADNGMGVSDLSKSELILFC